MITMSIFWALVFALFVTKDEEPRAPGSGSNEREFPKGNQHACYVC